ncbi:MAG: hypothetical protein KF749_04755 [Bacteroidetes bacterium]|nr:hypothetical protein [Bacteroidota bacterium]MCW5895421.1 hypothetical protein [Bacteroidota bacterium]
MKTLVFGADGGGTKTLGLIADGNGSVLVQKHVEGTNVNVVGFDVAAARLYSLIADCCADAGCAVAELQGIVLGLAGAGRAENRTRLREEIAKLAARELPLVIETDARVGLEGAFNGGPGILVIAGTGSAVMGKNNAGKIVSAGGWGRMLGDEGSGFWLGSEALKSVARWYDGRGGSHPLAGLIRQEFGFDNRDSVIGAVYHEGFELSRLAPLVIKAAAEGVDVAREILARGAAELAGQAQSVAAQLAIEGQVGVVLSGGLLEHESGYTRILRTLMVDRVPDATVQTALHPPAYGAALLAREYAKRSLQFNT